MVEQITFYFFAALAVVGAILTVTRRNAIHSAIFLITSLLATAGLYLQLRAEFLFAVQIILYVGGIMVLFLFVIMLVNLDVAVRQIQFSRQWSVALILVLAVGSQLGYAIYTGGKAFNLPAPSAASLEPNTENIATAIFSNYILPFEIASILLLVAMIGAVLMARKRV